MYDTLNIVNVTNGRLDIMEENISEPKEITMETIHNESQREKNIEKKGTEHQ